MTVVFLHGLGGIPGNFDKMKNDLEAQLPQGTKFLALEEEKTAEDCIKVQASNSFKKLETEGVGKETPIILVGHSQGGLRAYSMIMQHGKELNVKGLVSIGTPWKSTPLLGPTLKPWLTNKLVPQLATFGAMLDGFIPKAAQEQLKLWAKSGKDGVEDMTLNSDFLNGIYTNLKSNQVPVYAIAGRSKGASSIYGTFQAQLPMIVPMLDSMAEAKDTSSFSPAPDPSLLSAELEILKSDSDLLVSRSSQQGKGINNKSAAFTSHTVENVVHFPKVPDLTFVLDSAEVIKHVKKFIEKNK